MLIDQVYTATPAEQWLILFDVQTGRIAHITEDTSIAMQIESVSLVGVTVSNKPADLNSSNCAAWIYNSHGLAPYCSDQNKANSVSLFEFNRQSVSKLLNDKVDTIRKAKLDVVSINQFLQGQWDFGSKTLVSGSAACSQNDLLLINKAAAQNQSVAETRASVARATNQRGSFLMDTERRREELLKEILQADSKQLVMLREKIVSELSLVAIPQEKAIEASGLDEVIQSDELLLEKMRLRAMLEQKINQIRRPYTSGYLGSDVAQKMLRLAANNWLVLKHQAHSGDLKMLISYAAARLICIDEAAERITEAHKQLESMLFDTEQLKDSVNAKIDAAISQEQFYTLANDIIKYRFFVKDRRPSESSRQEKKVNLNDTISPDKIRERVQKFKPTSGDMREIKRFTTISQEEFSHLSQAGQPFIITELIKEWPVYALGLSWLKFNCGQISVKARINDYVANAFSKSREHLNLSLYDYLESMEQGAFDADSLPPYLGNQVMPEVSALCNWPKYFEDWAATKTWIGPKGTVTPLHCDYNDNLFAQIAGSKKFMLYPPHAVEKLNLKQVNPVLFASVFDPIKPNFQTHPEMKGVQPLECVVNKGELLYLPAGWFHHVSAVSFSFSVNRWSRGVPAVLQIRPKQAQLKSSTAKERGVIWKS